MTPTPPRAATHLGAPKKGLRIDELLKQAVKGIDLIRNAPYEEISASTWMLFQHSLGSYRVFAKEACRQVAAATEAEAAKEPGTSMETAWDMPRNWSSPQTSGSVSSTGASNVSTKETEPGWLDTRKAKSLTVRLIDNAARDEARKRTGEQVLQAFKKMKTRYTEQLVAARITKGGDVLLHAAIVEAREKLERDSTWLKEADATAIVLRQISPVMIHGYAIGAVDVKKQDEVKARIKGQTKDCTRD